jgi:antitoxin CptB
MTEVPGEVRWRCRRGMLELDLLLEGFLAHGYSGLSETQRADFLRLLNRYDTDLQRWLLNGEAVEEKEFQEVVEAIRRAAIATTDAIVAISAGVG